MAERADKNAVLLDMIVDLAEKNTISLSEKTSNPSDSTTEEKTIFSTYAESYLGAVGRCIAQ